MINIFWNRQERRLRAGWRILLQGAVYYLFLIILSSMVNFIVTPISDATGLTAKIAASVGATGNFPVAASAPDYQVRLAQYARMIAGRPLQYILLSVTGLAVLWLAARLLDHRKLADYGFRLSRKWWTDFGFGLFLGAALMAFIFLVELAAGWVTITGTFSSPLLPFWFSITLGLMSFIGVGINEEILFRGYELRNLAEGLHLPKISARTALIASYMITSVIFGAFHLSNDNATWLSSAFIMLIAILLAFGYILTGELAIPIGIHITWNFFQGFVFGFPVSGGTNGGNSFIAIQQGGPVLWTGGAFGPEAGLVGILATVLGCGLIFMWVRYHYGKIQIQSRLAEYLPGEVEPTAQALSPLSAEQ